MELVSVVVPSFRQPQFLERAVTSALEQDYEQLEVVIVDDASGDRSLGLALALASEHERVRVIARRVNGGLGRARNTGLMAADGAWVTFLDSDDYLLPGAVSSRMRALRDAAEDVGPALVGAYGDWIHVGERVDHPLAVRGPRADLGVIDRATYTGDNVFICSSPIVRRDKLIEVGGFGEDLPMLEDFVAWVRLLDAGGVFVPTHHVVCAYRQRPMSMLRGRGLVLPTSVLAINDWWLSRGGTLGDGGRLADWCDSASPHRHQRIDWRQAGAGAPPRPPLAAATGAPPRRTDDYRRMRDQLHRSSEDLTTALTDTDEAQRNRGVCQLRGGDMRKADIVLVPTDLEGALECAVLAPRLHELGLTVQISVMQARDLGLVPASLLGRNLIGVLEHPDQGVLHVLFSSTDKAAAALVAAIGKENVQLRVTGVESFRVFRRGFAQRYRQPASLLLRSRLEIAEIGDRVCDWLPSGARFAAPGDGAQSQSPVVYVPASAAPLPAIEAWVSSITGGLARVGREPLLLGGPQVARRLPAFRFTDPQAQALTGPVVLPVCDEVALLEALGVPAVLFDPGYSASEFSRPWAAIHPVAQTVEEVTACLASPASEPTPQWAAELSRLHDPQATADEWAKLFLTLVESRRTSPVSV